MVRWLTLLSWLLCAVTDADQPIDVIIVAGQSNAVGFDAAPDQLPTDPIDAKIPFWWRCGDPPPDEHDSVSNGWTTLKPQSLGDPIKPRRDRQYGNFAQATGGFGPEMGLARVIASKRKRPLAIIKVAFSGTHVAGDWNPELDAEDAAAGEHDSRGACYRSLIDETRRALEKLSENYQPHVVALVWVQGESDANPERAETYQRNMGAMIKSIREDLDAPELIALLGVNTKFGGGNNKHLADVIAAQKACAESDLKTQYVDTDGASIANNVHFDAAGTIEIGERFAKALQSLQSAK